MIILKRMLLIFTLAVSGVLAPAHGQSFGNVVYAGQMMGVERDYFSPSKRYFVRFQADGNLVVYRVETPVNKVIWAAASNGGKAAIFQEDGNLVIYSSTSDPRSVIWASNTGGSGNVSPGFYISDNGRIEVYGRSGLVFRSAIDPEYVPGGGSCQTPAQYPICIFPGTSSQWNSWVLACSPQEAMQMAAAAGAYYGRCPGT